MARASLLRRGRYTLESLRIKLVIYSYTGTWPETLSHVIMDIMGWHKNKPDTRPVCVCTWSTLHPFCEQSVHVSVCACECECEYEYEYEYECECECEF